MIPMESTEQIVYLPDDDDDGGNYYDPLTMAIFNRVLREGLRVKYDKSASGLIVDKCDAVRVDQLINEEMDYGP